MPVMEERSFCQYCLLAMKMGININGAGKSMTKESSLMHQLGTNRGWGIKPAGALVSLLVAFSSSISAESMGIITPHSFPTHFVYAKHTTAHSTGSHKTAAP